MSEQREKKKITQILGGVSDEADGGRERMRRREDGGRGGSELISVARLQ